MSKTDLKWPKIMVFGLFKKIMSLVLSGICVKSKFLWFINILRKLHAFRGDLEKPIYRGRLPKKGGLGQFVGLKGELGKKDGVNEECHPAKSGYLSMRH